MLSSGWIVMPYWTSTIFQAMFRPMVIRPARKPFGKTRRLVPVPTT
jgi:hypothetical protein